MIASVAVVLLLHASSTNAQAPSDPNSTASRSDLWSLEKAYREKTATRERICLNGLWLWQPASDSVNSVPKENWGFFKVPGCWPGVSDSMQKDFQKVQPHPSWKSRDFRNLTTAWYQREIMIPKPWAERRIALDLEYLNSLAVVFLDGKKIGELRFPSGELDLTPFVVPGRIYNLSIFVAALPLKAVTLAFTDTFAAKEVKGTVARRGLCGDVFLVSTPREARITNLKIDPSVRRNSITFRADLSGLAPNFGYRLQAKISDHGREEKNFSSPVFHSSDLTNGQFTFEQPWHPTKLWDLHTPQNQYDAALSLLEETSRPIDEYFSTRFGFRELWIDGADFKLNGSRLFWSGVPLDNAQIGVGTATYDAAKESMLRLRSIGINMVYGHNYDCAPGSHLSFEEILRAADDVGMLVALSQPHFGNYDWNSPDADGTNGYAHLAAFYVRVAQNHPSVIAYATSHNQLGYSEMMNPDMIDGTTDPREDWSKNNSKKALRAEAIIRNLDPARLIYHHSAGNFGDVYTSNFYLDMVPIQERSDWFEHWAAKGGKPLFLCEYGMPYFLNWTMYRGWYRGVRAWGSASVPYEFCLAEWDAQWLGDRAFRLDEMEKKNLRWEAKKFRDHQVWHHWDYPATLYSAAFDQQHEVFAQYTADNWRAFRTWGVSGTSPWNFGLFWRLRSGVNKKRQDFRNNIASLQRPGYSPDFVEQQVERVDLAFQRSDWIPTEAGRALLRNNQPLLTYVGGKPGAFTEKGHNFYPGETIEKQIIIVNNSRETVSCDCVWSLNLPSQIAGNARVSVPTGEIKKILVQFQLPASLAAGRYKIKASVRFNSRDVQEDEFAIDILPRNPSPKLKMRIAIFDPAGETTRELQRLGLRADAVATDHDFSKYDALIIGKRALQPDGPSLNLRPVRDGLKVVVFEQTSAVLEQRFGFRVQEYGLRNVFQRVPDHPLLAGLSVENLRDWRGEATILPSRLTYEMRARYGPTITNCGMKVTRPWRSSNRGNVASVLIEKPATGDFLPIIDGGFSLQYSPLLEYHEGRGMILFCQLDLTARTDNDPAAEQLENNLLKYLSVWKPSPRRTVLYAGEPAGLKHLLDSGFSAEPLVMATSGEIDSTSGSKKTSRALQSENKSSSSKTTPTNSGSIEAAKSKLQARLTPNSVLVVTPKYAEELARSKDVIAAWLKKGGHVVAVGLDAAQARAILPVNLETKSAEHIAAIFDAPDATSPLAGIGPADVHNRDPRSVPLITGGAKVVGDGTLAIAENGSILFCQLTPWQFDSHQQTTKRTFRRTSYLLSRVLGNFGAESQTPLLDRFAKPLPSIKAGASEQRWLTGFYLDTPEEWDDPYRYFQW